MSSRGVKRGHALIARRPHGFGQRILLCTALVVGSLRGLGLHAPSLSFATPGQRAAEEQVGLARRSVLGAALLAGPAPAQAVLGIGESPSGKAYTIAEVYSISFPPEWEVLNETTQGLILQGDRIQPLERMTAAAKVVKYSSLKEGWGANITEVGERIAAKRPSGPAQLVEAKVDPTGQGLDLYQFAFEGDQLSELWLIALVKRGGENVLCNVACRTPKQLWETKKDTFGAVMQSFKPLTAAAPEPEAVSVS